MWLFAKEIADQLLDHRHSGLAADQDNFVDVFRF
jgi:hypothetical protein